MKLGLAQLCNEGFMEEFPGRGIILMLEHLVPFQREQHLNEREGDPPA
jgi:hypothetical protein